jgi:hypothetical protein
MRTRNRLKIQIPLQVNLEKYQGSLGGYFEEESRYNTCNPLFQDLYRGVHHISVEGNDKANDPINPPALVVDFDDSERTLADIQDVLLKLGINTTAEA